MASVGCVRTAINNTSKTFWNPRGKDFFPDFDFRLELDDSVFRPYEKLSGKLKVNTTKEMSFYRGIRIQLEATVKFRFETKVDNRKKTNWKIESILQDGPTESNDVYMASPVYVQIMGNGEESKEKFKIKAGKHTYPFTLLLPGEPLPCPFKTKFGKLEYIIAAYMGWKWGYLNVAETSLRFRGFNDLSQQPNCLFEPIRNECGLRPSLFSSKTSISVIFNAERSGFLPGEQIPFTLTIVNPNKCFTLKNLSVNLVRRISYNANGAIKSTLEILDKFETLESRESFMDSDDSITLGQTLTIPKPCIPSYKAKPIYNVNHYIQYEVSVANSSMPVKGQVEIIIGTTKEFVMLKNRRMSSLLADVDDGTEGFVETDRAETSRMSFRMSRFSIASDSHSSMPPGYSQLSSRAMSLDNMPLPCYDETN